MGLERQFLGPDVSVHGAQKVYILVPRGLSATSWRMPNTNARTGSTLHAAQTTANSFTGAMMYRASPKRMDRVGVVRSRDQARCYEALLSPTLHWVEWV